METFDISEENTRLNKECMFRRMVTEYFVCEKMKRLTLSITVG